MDERDIKTEVRSYYAGVAQQGKSCCGGGASSCGCGSAVAGDPAIASADLGLGCGLPTEHAGIQPGQTVLDLGSGAGVDVFRAARQVGPTGRVIGVDMTPEMIERARANAINGGFQNVEFRLGDIEALPVEDGTVDVALSNCVINLAPDKSKVFKEVNRVLKPGGHFSISDIVTFGKVPDEIRQDIELWAGCISGAMDEEDYMKIISDAGFSEIVVRNYQQADYPKGEDFGVASITLEAAKQKA